MKKLTYDQKKWALTACLLAALGFNVSFNGESTHKLGGSSELASKTIDSKYASDDGKTYDVTYIEKGDKTIALIPAAAEGKVCETGECMSSHVLDTKFTSDVQSLEAALRKDIKSVKPADKIEEKVTASVDPEEKAKSDEQAIFDNILNKCSKKADDRVLDCKVNELAKVLRKKDSKISKQGALDFYKEEMERDLIDYMSSPMNYDPITGFDLVSKLQTDISKEYSSLRSRVALDAVQAVRAQAEQAQQTIRQAEQYKKAGNMTGALQANSQAATILGQYLPTVYNGLDTTMTSSLSQAVSQRLISSQDAYRIINDMYRNSAMPIYNGIVMNPSTYQIPQFNLDLANPMMMQPGVQPTSFAPAAAPAASTVAPSIPTAVIGNNGSVHIIQSNNGGITGPAGAAPVANPRTFIIQRQ